MTQAYYSASLRKGSVGAPLEIVGGLQGNLTRQCNVATSGFPVQIGFYSNPDYDPLFPDAAGNFEYLYNNCQTPTAGCCSNTFKLWANVIGGSGDYKYTWTMPAVSTWALMDPATKYVYIGRAGSADAQNSISLTVTDNVTLEEVSIGPVTIDSVHIPINGGP